MDSADETEARAAAAAGRAAVPVMRGWNPSVTIRGRSWTLTVYAMAAILAVGLAVVIAVFGIVPNDGMEYSVIFNW